MNKNPKRIVILGAGVAGLAAAWKLLRGDGNLHVTLIERDPVPGGLAKSIEWKGYTLDLGPHRFHTEIPEVKDFIKTFCEERMMQVQRASRMYLNGSYIPYPIQAKPTFQALGFSDSVSFAISALGSLFQAKKEAVSYEDYIIGYYGDKLYRRIFQPYAEKVWGIPADRIAAETARVRLRGENIWHALKDGLFSKQETYVGQFLYPPNGVGEIPHKFADEVSEMGGNTFHKHTVNKIHLKNGRVRSVEVAGPLGVINLECDFLINTTPLSYFVRLTHPQASAEIRAAAGALQYRSIKLLFVQYGEELPITDTWLYYPEEHVPFSRIYVPDNFLPQKKQPGKTCLCIEFPCEIDSEIWKMEAMDLAHIADDALMASGLTQNRSVDALAVKIKEGYPIYEIGYEENVQTATDYLRSFGNCLTTGRQGLFRHNNLDQSLQMGLLAGEHVLQHENCDSWYDTISQFNHYRIVD